MNKWPPLKPLTQSAAAIVVRVHSEHKLALATRIRTRLESVTLTSRRRYTVEEQSHNAFPPFRLHGSIENYHKDSSFVNAYCMQFDRFNAKE